MQTQNTPAVSETSRAAALLARFRAVRAATMDFIAPLTPEDMMVQSSPDASPVKWHLAHTSWFFETFVLSEFVAAYQPFHPDFHWLFNSYYKALGDMPAKKLRASFSRPPLDRHPRLPMPTSTPPSPASARANPGSRRSPPPHHGSRPRTRAAAPRARRHRHQTRLLHQPATPRLPSSIPHTQPRLPAHHLPSTRVGSLQSSALPGGPNVVEIGITPDPADPRRLRLRQRDPPPPRLHRSPSASPRAQSPAPSTSPSSTKTATTAPSSGSPRAGTPCSAEGWQAPLYWRRDTATPSGWSVFTLQGYQAPRRALRNPRLPPQLLLKPTPSPAGLATVDSPPSSNGNTPPPTPPPTPQPTGPP